MRLAFTLCITLLLAASDAAAGIDLTWNGCAAGGASNALVFTCDDPGYQAYLVGSFRVPADVDSFYGLDVTIDVYSENGSLPEFWDFTAVEGCNATGLTRQLVRPPLCTNSTNVWGTGGLDGNGTYVYVTPFRGSAKRARLVASFFRPTTIFDLAAGTDYFGFSFLVSTSHASEAGGDCTGCAEPIAFVWNRATFFTDSAILPELEMSDAGTVGICARANGAVQASCDAVPAKRSTWGAIKALYR